MVAWVVVRSEVLAEDLKRVRSEAVNPVERVVVIKLDLDPEVLLLLLGDGALARVLLLLVEPFSFTTSIHKKLATESEDWSSGNLRL